MRTGCRKEKEQPLLSYVLSFNVVYIFTSEQYLKKVAFADTMGEKNYQENKQYVLKKFREILLM